MNLKEIRVRKMLGKLPVLHHAFDVQIFNHYRLIKFRQIIRQLMRRVFANTAEIDDLLRRWRQSNFVREDRHNFLQSRMQVHQALE